MNDCSLIYFGYMIPIPFVLVKKASLWVPWLKRNILH